MSLGAGAWKLAKRDLTKDKWTYLWAMIICFAIVIGITTYDQVKQIMEAEGVAYNITFLHNMIVLLMFQTLGFGMGRNYLTKYYKTDLFTKRNSYLNTMPISNNQIIFGRYIQHIITLILMYVVIFSAIGLWGNLFDIHGFTGVQFIQLIMTCMGYSCMFGSIYILLELGFHGRVYFIMSCVITGCFMIGCGILTFVYRISIWHVVLDIIKVSGWVISGLSLGVAALVTLLMAKLLQRRMKLRDLYL